MKKILLLIFNCIWFFACDSIRDIPQHVKTFVVSLENTSETDFYTLFDSIPMSRCRQLGIMKSDELEESCMNKENSFCWMI